MTLQELLADIAKQKFIYLIQLNGQYIINNGVPNVTNCSTSRHYLTKDLACDVLIEIDPEPHSTQQMLSLVVRYSEKIFNDTANIYILNLGQIFVLLKNFGVNYSVIRQHNSTILTSAFDISK